MNTQETSKITPAAQDAQETPACFEDLQDAQHLAHEVEKLVNNYEPLQKLDGISEQLQNLKELADAYRDGLSAADALAREGKACIEDLKERTKLAAEELQRLEDDGGPAPTKEQQAEKDALIKAAKKIENIAPVIERQFGGKEETEQNAETKTAA